MLGFDSVLLREDELFHPFFGCTTLSVFIVIIREVSRLMLQRADLVRLLHLVPHNVEFMSIAHCHGDTIDTPGHALRTKELFRLCCAEGGADLVQQRAVCPRVLAPPVGAHQMIERAQDIRCAHPALPDLDHCIAPVQAVDVPPGKISEDQSIRIIIVSIDTMIIHNIFFFFVFIVVLPGRFVQGCKSLAHGCSAVHEIRERGEMPMRIEDAAVDRIEVDFLLFMIVADMTIVAPKYCAGLGDGVIAVRIGAAAVVDDVVGDNEMNETLG